MPIRLGIIGLSADQTAWATATHAVSLKSAPLSNQYTITALATSSPESAKKAAKAHGVPENKAYHDAESLAQDSDVDMVVVAVKLALHKSLSIPALNAKKPLFVEWPLGKNLKEAEEVAALAKKQGVKTVVGLQARLSPVVVKVKEIVESGALGRIVGTTWFASTSMYQNLPAKAHYINDPESGANLISIATTHSLDALCYALSEFKSLNATTATTFPTVQFQNPDGTKTQPEERKFADSIGVQGILESGATAHYSFNVTENSTPERFEWIISGDKGSLKVEGPKAFLSQGEPALYQSTIAEAAAWKGYAQKGPESGSDKWKRVQVPPAVHGGIGEVYAAFAEGKKGYVDFEGAVKRHRMVEALYRSAEKGTRESY